MKRRGGQLLRRLYRQRIVMDRGQLCHVAEQDCGAVIGRRKRSTMIESRLHHRAVQGRTPVRRHRWTPLSIVAVLLAVTLLCVPVVVLQHNWAGLGVVLVALAISTRELISAMRKRRTATRN